MKKPDALRAYLTSTLPELARDPEALQLYVTGGTLASRYTENLNFEERYTLHLILLNYRGEPEQVFLPVLLWLRAQQVDLIQNHASGVQDIKFNVDVLDNQAVDLEIEFPLSEAVEVYPQDDGSHQMKLRDEVLPEDMAAAIALLRQIWAPGEPGSEFMVGYPD